MFFLDQKLKKCHLLAFTCIKLSLFMVWFHYFPFPVYRPAQTTTLLEGKGERERN